MLELSADKIAFCDSINAFITNLREYHKNNFNSVGVKKSIVEKAKTVFQSMLDLLNLIAICEKTKYSTIVFIGPNLLNYEDFLNKHRLKNCLFINYHNTKNMGALPCGRVFNLGILVGIFNRLSNRKRNYLKSIEIYNWCYNFIIKIFAIKDIYIPCFYDQMGMSLILDKNRSRFHIIEVQHGGICNFFPYTLPVSFKISDKIFVNNTRTEKYLREHLYKNVGVEIVQKEIMHKEEKIKISSQLILLYCSSIEVNGIHNVMMSFLESNLEIKSFKLLVRLHPREMDKEDFFRDSLNKLNQEFEFDNSKNWMADRNTENLIVITPWSSVVEEAYDNNILSIIIDPYGKERYYDIIDNKLCYYSDDLKKTIKKIINQYGI